MSDYWVTVSVPAENEVDALALAARIAVAFNGRVIQVDNEPPQGSLIVGDYSY
jgi:hypothetical protein